MLVIAWSHNQNDGRRIAWLCNRDATGARTAAVPVEPAARIIGQKWTLQIVYFCSTGVPCAFMSFRTDSGGVNPSTLSSRLKMLEEEGMVRREQISAIPPTSRPQPDRDGPWLESVIRGDALEQQLAV